MSSAYLAYLEISEFYHFLTARQKLPKHLQHLLSLTPSGERKLIAAWDGLTNESQIQILECLSSINKPILSKLLHKALECDAPYIRYLAKKQLGSLPTDLFPEQSKLSGKEIKKLYASYVELRKEEDIPFNYTLEEFQSAYKVCADPSPLVRGSVHESTTPNIHKDMASRLSNEKFFDLSQDDRLAAVRDWDFDLFAHDHVENLSGLISYAIEKNLVDDEAFIEELCEIISDAFAYGQKFGYLDDEGHLDTLHYRFGQNKYDPLWQLVTTALKKEIAFDLPATLACTIPVISNTAFHDLLLSAPSHDFFDFTIWRWKALRIVHYEALTDHFHEGLKSRLGLPKERLAEFSAYSIQFRYSILSPETKKYELRELKLYRLAKELASSGNVPKKFSELKGKIIPGKVFKTFLNLENTSLPIGVKLPIIEELEGAPDDLPYEPPPIDKMIADTKAVLMEELRECQSNVSEEFCNIREELSAIEERQKNEFTEAIRNRYFYARSGANELSYGLIIVALLCSLILWKVW